MGKSVRIMSLFLRTVICVGIFYTILPVALASASSEDSWSTGTAGGTARISHTSVVYNGKIYSWGGVNVSRRQILNTLDIYDIAHDSWSTGTAGGTARSEHSSVLYNGKIYSWGGSDGNGCLGTMDIYDIAHDSWSTGATSPVAKEQHTSVVYNGKIYSWGGRDGDTTFNDVDIYDIAHNSWSAGTAGGHGRYTHTSVLYNSKIYSWGGVTGYSSFMDIYDVTNDSWSAGTASDTNRVNQSSSGLYDGRIYSWGGRGGDNDLLNTISIYDIVNDSWSVGTVGGTARENHASILYYGKIYSWGGTSESGSLNTLDIYDTSVLPTYKNLPNDNREINLDEGQIVTESPYTLKVRPSTGSGITGVNFYVDDTLLCTITNPDSDGVYSCDWDTEKYHSDVRVLTYFERNDPIALERSTIVQATSTQTATAQSSATQDSTILPETGANTKGDKNIAVSIISIVTLCIACRFFWTKKMTIQ